MRRRPIFRRLLDHDAAPLSGGHEQRGPSDVVPHFRNEKNRAADAQGTRAVGSSRFTSMARLVLQAKIP
jgi:hypothetical protein